MPARDMNYIRLEGRLAAAPEIRLMPSGMKVALFRMFTNEPSYMGTNGERKEESECHRCEVYGPEAEKAEAYIKGQRVRVEGKITYPTWKDKATGVQRYGVLIKGRAIDAIDTNGRLLKQIQAEQDRARAAVQTEQPMKPTARRSR